MRSQEEAPIVCGIDFSRNSNAAAEVAAVFAKRLDVPLLLVHVTSMALPEESEAPERPSIGRDLLLRRLREEGERLRSSGVVVEEQVVSGTPDEKLTDVAGKIGARMIVLSALGMRSKSRWLIGSVAERTGWTSPVPTLVVRSAEPFVAWARGERAMKVFVGVDFTTNSDAALRWVAELRRVGPCEVVAAYADWPPKEASRLGVSEPLRLVDNMPDVQRMLERDMSDKVSGLLGKEDLRILVEGCWGRKDAQLVGMAEEQRADLMVVGTHRRSGFGRLWHGSVSRGILQNAPMSVACVPTPAVGPMAGPRIRQYRRVLAAVDLDSSHGFVAPYAYGLVDRGGAVLLLHVIEPYRPPNPLIGGYYQNLPTREEQAGQAADATVRLRALAPESADAPEVTTEVEVIEDPQTAKAICGAAERFNADVVCIGGHTRPGFTARILGSVSQGVLQRSCRPVLVVWPPAG